MKTKMKIRRNEGVETETIRGLIIGFIIALLIFTLASLGESAEGDGMGIILNVKARTIQLPGNNVSRVPLSMARVRSDELKAVNTQYGAAMIERLYKMPDVEKGGGALASKAAEKNIDLAAVFTKEKRKEMEALGKDVEQVKDTYLLTFAPGVLLDNALADYQALDVVTEAMKVNVKGN